MVRNPPTNAKQLARLLEDGEGPQLEFKRSTGELKEGMQTICAFLNGTGGLVLFGIRPNGVSAGQEVSDHTLRDIAQAVSRLEPPVQPLVHRIKIGLEHEVIVLTARPVSGAGPFTYEGRAYERVGSTRNMLNLRHPSIQRNPIIADVFNRAGLIEKWGRGTNRVAQMCRAARVVVPTYEEIGGSVLVTFRVNVGRTAPILSRAESGAESGAESIPFLLEAEPLRISDWARRSGSRTVIGSFKCSVRKLIDDGMVERTIPDKPNSRLQKYRLTAKGRERLIAGRDSRA